MNDTVTCPSCDGRGCSKCYGTGAPTHGRACRDCGHPESLHHRGSGECVALLTSGWDFCSCAGYEMAPETSEG